MISRINCIVLYCHDGFLALDFCTAYAQLFKSCMCAKVHYDHYVCPRYLKLEVDDLKQTIRYTICVLIKYQIQIPF